MTHRCNHCQAENLVADGQAPGAPAPMCMRCGQPMQLGAAPSAPAPGASAAVGAPAAPLPGAKLANLAPVDAASEFEGSTVMVMRPDVQRAKAGGGAAPSLDGAAANEEAWFALVDGVQQGPHTLVALRHAFGEGRLHGSTLLWRAGMAAWTPLDNLPEVRAALAAPQDTAAKAQAAKALLHLVEEEVPAKADPPAASAATSTGAPAPASHVGAAGPSTQPTRVVEATRATGRPRAYAVAAAGLLLAAAVVGWVTLRPRPAAEVAKFAPADAPAGPSAPTPPPANVAAQVTSAAQPPPAPVPPAASATPAPTGAPAAAPSSQPVPQSEAPVAGADGEGPPPAALEAPSEHEEAPASRHHGRRRGHGRHRGARH